MFAVFMYLIAAICFTAALYQRNGVFAALITFGIFAMGAVVFSGSFGQ